MRLSFLKGLYSNTGYYLGFIGIIATLFVITHPINISGLELYFLLPFIYSLCVIRNKEVFLYHVDGFGLKCFYLVTFVRYVILPVYASSNGIIGTYNNLNSSYYGYGIFVQILELLVSYTVIRLYYPKVYNKISSRLVIGKQYYNSPGIGGLFLGCCMIGVVVLRGHMGAITEMARFLVVTEKYDMEADFWTYDLWAIQVFFSYLVILVTSYFMQRNDRKDSWTNVIIPLVLAFLSCSIILTNNRMTMVYYALSGLCVLNAAFPKKSKILSTAMIGVMLTVIISFTLMKNFGVDISSESADVSNNDGVSTLSAYVCGVDNIAHTCDMYSRNGSLFGIKNFFSMIYNFCMPTRLPFLHGLLFKGTPTAVDLACQSTEMVSVAGETYFWGGGMYLGWLFDIIAVYIIVRLLIYFEIHTKLELDLGKKYIYNWLAVLFGIFMCYCIQTLWNNTTYMPLFLSCALWVNKKLRFKRTEVLR